MMEAVRTSETSVDNYFTRQYIPEDNSEHRTRRRENLKSHKITHVNTRIIEVASLIFNKNMIKDSEVTRNTLFIF
jgi:glutamate/tyrosine decarboxylase-like PLP-dependent enzyme